MTHGSLFSGIGGFDLAAEWMGWENVFHCEINKFCNKVLKYYWPNAKSYEDIKATGFSEWKGRVDVVSGGFPCQPFSTAGKRKGKEDNRYLWPEMLRVIREVRPKWIVGENVFGIVNWSRGMVFEQVQTDLETEGYQSQAYVLPACAVNAPHRRDRTWFIAHSTNIQWNEGQQCRNGGESFGGIVGIGSERDVANTNIGYLEESKRKSNNVGKKNERQKTIGHSNGITQNWNEWPTQSPICSRDDGLSSELVGITLSKHRTESIKGYGNAIVPQVAYEIFKVIDIMEK